MKTKKEINYRTQNDEYENRNKKCENCRNFFAVTPYKNRCTVIGIDINDKTKAVKLDEVCDELQTF